MSEYPVFEAAKRFVLPEERTKLNVSWLQEIIALSIAEAIHGLTEALLERKE